MAHFRRLPDDGDDMVKWKEDRLRSKANLFASYSLIEVYTWSGKTVLAWGSEFT